MKVDSEYCSRLLTVFQNAPSGTTDISELQQADFSLDDPQFDFHLRLLYEERLIASDHGGIGLDTSADGGKMWSVIPLRLTAGGHARIEEVSSAGPVGRVGFDY
jgi:hypothetical protein